MDPQKNSEWYGQILRAVIRMLVFSYAVSFHLCLNINLSFHLVLIIMDTTFSISEKGKLN